MRTTPGGPRVDTQLPHLFLAVTLVTAACAGHMGARGRVVALNGEPVAGVSLDLDASDPTFELNLEPVKHWRSITSVDGCFQLGRAKHPHILDYTLSVAKDGFQPLSVRIRGNDAPVEYRIRLALATESAAGAWFEGRKGEAGCNWRRTPSETETPSGSKEQR